MDNAQTQLDRIEAKLDMLIAALADEVVEPEAVHIMTLDGDFTGGERDQDQPL